MWRATYDLGHSHESSCWVRRHTTFVDAHLNISRQRTRNGSRAASRRHWKSRPALGSLYPLLLGLSTAQFCAGSSALCQLSFTSAIDLSLRNSSRVKLAQDEVNKAAATLVETRSVFIPSITAGSGVGASSGITLNVPTIFTINAQALRTRSRLQRGEHQGIWP
jgi:hypothetical protein